MRAFKKYNNRGFTLIELMIVVAIVGVLAALAIYGVRKYLLNAKTAEARNAVGQMAKDAKAAYERENMPGAILAAGASAANSNELCGSATAVPASMAAVKGKKYQSTTAEWAVGQATATVPATGWPCLRFAMTDPQYYQYGYTKTNSGLTGTFAAVGQGDLNGDGTLFSSFTINGAVQADGTVFVSPSLIEVSPDE